MSIKNIGETRDSWIVHYLINLSIHTTTVENEFNNLYDMFSNQSYFCEMFYEHQQDAVDYYFRCTTKTFCKWIYIKLKSYKKYFLKQEYKVLREWIQSHACSEMYINKSFLYKLWNTFETPTFRFLNENKIFDYVYHKQNICLAFQCCGSKCDYYMCKSCCKKSCDYHKGKN